MAATLVVLIVVIVVSPFVDLPLTTTRTSEGLVIVALVLAAIVSRVIIVSDFLFLPVAAWGGQIGHDPHENRADALSLNVVRLC